MVRVPGPQERLPQGPQADRGLLPRGWPVTGLRVLTSHAHPLGAGTVLSSRPSLLQPQQLLPGPIFPTARRNPACPSECEGSSRRGGTFVISAALWPYTGPAVWMDRWLAGWPGVLRKATKPAHRAPTSPKPRLWTPNTGVPSQPCVSRQLLSRASEASYFAEALPRPRRSVLANS